MVEVAGRLSSGERVGNALFFFSRKMSLKMVLSSSSLFVNTLPFFFFFFFYGKLCLFERERERFLERTSLSDSKKQLL
ncbi:hypothetical protein EUGRSUZ_H01695 [Eucalyptus grandis]|uniref:Uncharacterized protein n=2 Tax=Eucalyptus grandis TaxID=71139 RepID=A0A059AZL4_EUCGR|nr:hypothetical protein EUGRSUZ_H01695 [Eucalyptus grandis]